MDPQRSRDCATAVVQLGKKNYFLEKKRIKKNQEMTGH